MLDVDDTDNNDGSLVKQATFEMPFNFGMHSHRRRNIHMKFIWVFIFLFPTPHLTNHLNLWTSIQLLSLVCMQHTYLFTYTTVRFTSLDFILMKQNTSSNITRTNACTRQAFTYRERLIRWKASWKHTTSLLWYFYTLLFCWIEKKRLGEKKNNNDEPTNI